MHLLSPPVEDKIVSFVTSNVENNNNDSSETLDLTDNAYKNIKYKEIKDILLQNIKNDVKEFIENEIEQKLDNKEEYQTLVDKRIIATLEKEIEFLKTEICSKMKLLINFSTIIPRRTITIIWREKYGTLVIHAILVILALFAVQSSQETR